MMMLMNHEEKAESFVLMKGQNKTPAAAAAAKLLQSCLTLCDPIDSSPPEKQLNELEIGNLPEKEFRIMIMKMIQDLRERMESKVEKMPEMFNKGQ